MCLDVTAIYQLQYISSLDAFRCWSSKEIPNRKVPFHDSTRCPKHLQWHPNVPLRTSPWHHSFFGQILQFSTAGMSRKTLLFSRHLWSSTSCWWFRNPVITTWDGAKTRRKSWEQTTNLNWLSRISFINMESFLTKTARFDNFRQLQISVNQARGRIHCTGPRRTSSRRKVNLIHILSDFKSSLDHRSNLLIWKHVQNPSISGYVSDVGLGVEDTWRSDMFSGAIDGIKAAKCSWNPSRETGA